MALGDYRYILTSAGGPNVKKQFYRLWWGAADQCAVSRVTRSSGGNTSSNTQFLMEWRGCASAMGVMKLPPTVLVQKPLCNQFISYYYMCSCWVCGINHFKLRDFAVAALDSLQPLIKVVQWPGYIDGPWRSVVARRLNLWRPSTSVISIGMEHLFLVTLLFVPGAHFTNNFSITIQMWWKFHFALIQILIKWSLQYLAHGTTAGLSWHVPNFVAIWSPVIELKLNEIFIKFELWWKNR